MPSIRLTNFRGIAPRLRADDARMQAGRDDGMFVDALQNGYVADDGVVVALPGPQTVATGTGWRNGVSTPAGLLVHDKGAGTLIADPAGDADIVVSGLSTTHDAVFQPHQGLIYWWCGTDRGRITPDGVNYPWALPQAATPTVTTIAGTMPAGRYLVSVTWLDSTGAESGCAPSFEATLATPGALRIAVGTIPADVDKVRVYVSPPNGQQPAWVADVATSAFPYDVTTAHDQAGTKALIPLRTQGLDPLPVGDGMTTRGGFLLTWSDAVLWFSAGSWSHLCDVSRNLVAFPSDILGAVGVDGGVWVVTETGAYWVGGPDLNQASVVPVISRRKYATGGVRAAAADAFGVQTTRDVALFASSEGPVVGTADGQLVAPLADSQLWDVAGKSAQIVPFEQDGTRLLGFNLVEVA